MALKTINPSTTARALTTFVKPAFLAAYLLTSSTTTANAQETGENMPSKLAQNDQSEAFNSTLKSINQMRQKLADGEDLNNSDVSALRRINRNLTNDVATMQPKELRAIRDALFKLNQKVQNMPEDVKDESGTSIKMAASGAILSAYEKVAPTTISAETRTVSSSVPVKVNTGPQTFINLPGFDEIRLLNYAPNRPIIIDTSKVSSAEFSSYLPDGYDQRNFITGVANAFYLESLGMRQALGAKDQQALLNLGNSIADNLGVKASDPLSNVSGDLQASGKSWADMETLLRQGKVIEAFALLPRGSSLGINIGQVIDNSVIWDIKKGSAYFTLVDAGPVEMVLKGGMEVLEKWVREGKGADRGAKSDEILPPLIYAIGAYYKGAWANYIEQATKVTTGEVSQQREVTGKSVSQRIGFKATGAFGVNRKMSIILDAMIDNERQMVRVIPYVRRLESGSAEAGLVWRPTKIPAIGFAFEGLSIHTEGLAKLTQNFAKKEGVAYVSKDDVGLSAIFGVRYEGKKLQVQSYVTPLATIVDGSFNYGLDTRLTLSVGNPHKVMVYATGKGGIYTLNNWIGAEAGVNFKDRAQLGINYIDFLGNTNATHAIGLQLRFRF